MTRSGVTLDRGGGRAGACVRGVQKNFFEHGQIAQELPEQDGDVEPQHMGPQDGRREVSEVAVPLRMQGPAAVAWHLCQQAGLNDEQTNAVALIAWQMQKMWAERSEDGMLPTSWGQDNLRLMLLGGGGCGKTYTMLNVVKPLIELFFGPNSFEGQCPSNSGARLFGGRTIHASIGFNATSSLKVEHLALKGKTRTKVERITVPAAAVAIDEASQMSGSILHANALRHTYGRARAHNLQVENYMQMDQLFGNMPIVILLGDYLQLPPVPETSSVLWPAANASYEHRQGRAIISRMPLVYEFRKSNRFKDEALIRILAAMRTAGGQKLADSDWQALAERKIRAATPKQALSGHHQPDPRVWQAANWIESAYDWVTVMLAMQVRTRLAAAEARKVLWYIVAIDVPDGECPISIFRAMTGCPSVTTTKKLPGILPLYIGARVRLTKTLMAPELVPEREGTVVGLELHEMDRSRLRGRMQEQTSITEDGAYMLEHMPKCVFVKFDGFEKELMEPLPCEEHAVCGPERSCQKCKFFTGIVAVLPQSAQWTFRQSAGQQHKQLGKPSASIRVEVRRVQFPLVPALPKTLHGLQGVTADPGLLGHFRLPKVSKETKWLAYYVLLSRVRSLSQLLLHGLPDRSILEGGPPEMLQTAIDQLFQGKISHTLAECEAARKNLKWPSRGLS